VKNSFRKAVGIRACVGALAALLPLAAATPAHAAGDTLDQKVVETFWLSWQSSVPWMAQTFTAGMDGRVDRVSLPAYTPSGFGRFTVSLRTLTSAGAPSATVLGAAPLFSGGITCCQFRDYVFSSPVSVFKGTQYAIAVQVSAGSLRWFDTGGDDVYLGGRQYTGSPASGWGVGSHADFGFEEWVVAGNVNSAPTVGVDKGAFGVPEGTAPTNSGTCSDTDGDTVTLKASDGTVSPCTGGRWTWSKAAGDETGNQTVTIFADDGNGLSAQIPFTFDVTPVDPTASIVSDPPSITVPEGTNVPFTGTATSPDAADNAAGFTYAWSVTINGAAYAGGPGATFSFIPRDDGSYLVTFNAMDDGGMSGTTSMIVIATNVAPKAAITGVAGTVPLVTTPFETLSFSGAFTDVDTADHYTMTWNFGDGSTLSGPSVSHYYSLPGTYTVKFQVGDGEGGVGQATTTVTVQTTQQALGSLEAYVQSLPGLNAGQKNSLIVKLQNAGAAAARGDNNASSNELNAFLNELQADVNSGKVSPAAAGNLRSAVHAVQGSLGRFNRLVEWWPLEA
jgi:PKD domain